MSIHLYEIFLPICQNALQPLCLLAIVLITYLEYLLSRLLSLLGLFLQLACIMQRWALTLTFNAFDVDKDSNLSFVFILMYNRFDSVKNLQFGCGFVKSR